MILLIKYTRNITKTKTNRISNKRAIIFNKITNEWMRRLKNLASKLKPLMKERNKRMNLRSTEKGENMNSIWLIEKYEILENIRLE